MTQNNITIIGIDGGASKVSAHILEREGNDFYLSTLSTTKQYSDYPEFQKDFLPVDLKNQLVDIENNSSIPTEAELNQAKAYYSAFVDTIQELLNNTDSDKILLGIGMPGIKSNDGRGIIAMANGPRMPYFAPELEKRLKSAGIVLAAPVHKLGSDADYCGIGEEYSKNGSFNGVENAYYLGGGTGVADALKINDKLVSFDECKNWFGKTWEFKSKDGKSFEKYISANGIQSLYGNLNNTPQKQLIDDNIFLDQILKFAEEDEPAAIQCWQLVATMISELIYERICTLYCGWQNDFDFLDPNHTELEQNHKYIGIMLDKIVIGQRLGDLFRTPSAQKIIIQPILKKLTNLIESSNYLDAVAKSHYLKDGKFNSNILKNSNLREAPALGAGIDAWLNYDKS